MESAQSAPARLVSFRPPLASPVSLPTPRQTPTTVVASATNVNRRIPLALAQSLAPLVNALKLAFPVTHGTLPPRPVSRSTTITTVELLASRARFPMAKGELSVHRLVGDSADQRH